MKKKIDWQTAIKFAAPQARQTVLVPKLCIVGTYRSRFTGNIRPTLATMPMPDRSGPQTTMAGAFLSALSALEKAS